LKTNMVRHFLCAAACCAAFWTLPVFLSAATYTVSPGDNLQQAVNSLAAGDSLLFSAGVYTRQTALYFDSLQGEEGRPIVVGPAPGAEVTLQLDSTYTIFVIYDWDHNVIHVRNCHYLEIYGFEITAGRTGIETEFVNSHCTFRDLEIHHVGNVGIRIANGPNSYMKCLGNHIHHTYQHGEGYYIGDSDGSSDINNCIFEGNYIHHTTLLKSQGDGIEFKKGCWSNIARHNVIHDTHYPGILAWGTGKQDPQYNNKVYANLVFTNTYGEAGMQIASECDVFNNIIFDGGNGMMYAGIQSNQNTHSGTPMNHVRIYQNTIFATDQGVRLRDWGGKEGMVFANNAVYCLDESDIALNTNASDLSDAIIEGNYYYGRVEGAGLEALIDDGIIESFAPDEVFVSAENDITTIDLYPYEGSELIDAAEGVWVAGEDFNGEPRTSGGTPDVGAYEFSSAENPGWKIAEEHKPVPGDAEPEPPQESACDFNADGKADVSDVITLILLGRDNPAASEVDYNGDGVYNIIDAIALLLDIVNDRCSGTSAALASETSGAALSLSGEDIEHVEGVLAQMDLTAKQEAAFRLALYGDGAVKKASLPGEFSLGRNAPNPFNPSTTIEFSVPEGFSGRVSLRIHGLRGSLVRTLFQGEVQPGSHQVTWDGRRDSGTPAASGIYFCRLDAAGGTHVRKLVLLK